MRERVRRERRDNDYLPIFPIFRLDFFASCDVVHPVENV